MIAVSPLASQTYSYDTGTSGTVTAPAGCWVASFSCTVAAGGAAGSVTITPKGPNQTGTAGSAIAVPAGGSFGDSWPCGGPLGPGSIIVFSGTATYYVSYGKGGVM